MFAVGTPFPPFKAPSSIYHWAALASERLRDIPRRISQMNHPFFLSSSTVMIDAPTPKLPDHKRDRRPRCLLPAPPLHWPPFRYSDDRRQGRGPLRSVRHFTAPRRSPRPSAALPPHCLPEATSRICTMERLLQTSIPFASAPEPPPWSPRGAAGPDAQAPSSPVFRH